MHQCLGKRVVKEEKFPHTQKPPHKWRQRRASEFQRGTEQQMFGWKQNGQNSSQKLLPTCTSQWPRYLHVPRDKWGWGAEAQARMSDFRKRTYVGYHEDALRKLVQEMGESREETRCSERQEIIVTQDTLIPRVHRQWLSAHLWPT